MQDLRPVMATFIGDKAEYFKQFLTDEESKPVAWRRLLFDIRHSDGGARRWGGDLEISALSCMFQCPIQYITSRQGDAYEGLVIIQHNTSLHKWWRRFKKKSKLADDLYLEPLTLIYEEGRHWQSSEALIPQFGTSAAGGAPLATLGFSEGVRGGEVPTAGAPSRDALLPTMGPNRPSRSSSCSGNVVPSALLPRNPRTLNHFPLSDTSDSAYSEWLVKHSLSPFLGQPCSAVFTVGNGDIIFKGNFVNPATHSDSLVAGKATLRTPFCVLFSDKECKR